MLSQKDGQPIGDIARVLAMGKSSLTGLIDRMSLLGFVERGSIEGDGRVAIVFLTSKGRQVAKSSKEQTRAFNAELLAPFSETEIDTISRFLHHVSSNADTIINRTKNAA